ncbi:MAG: RNA polymerase sigma factor [Vulcanimicrobiota bacterium]
MRSDDELVKDFLGGQKSAFEELYARYSCRIFAFLVTEVGRCWAEDLLQETFSRVLTSLHRYQACGKFSSYLYQIAKNLARDMQRRAYRAIPIDELDGQAHPTEELETHIDIATVRSALKTLSLEQRQVVLLREYVGLSFKEIANLIERPLGTVLSQMHRAVHRLRSRLAVQGE